MGTKLNPGQYDYANAAPDDLPIDEGPRMTLADEPFNPSDWARRAAKAVVGLRGDDAIERAAAIIETFSKIQTTKTQNVLSSMDEWLGNSDEFAFDNVVEWRNALADALCQEKR